MFPMQTKLPRIAFVAIFGGLAAFPTCAQSLQERMSTCFNCHGEKGQSQRPEVPSLGAQPALYTLIELVMFRDQLRVTESDERDDQGAKSMSQKSRSSIISSEGALSSSTPAVKVLRNE